MRMADLAARVDSLEDAVRRIGDQIAGHTRLTRSEIGDLKADMAMIRADSLSNHAIVMKELVGLHTDLGTLRSDFAAMRQTVDALPSVIAKMFVERDRGS
jgi:hypothetical protein